ncbi:MAG: ribosome maturation factor RimM [Bacilli bacterium]|nr:ribosome maturation factor RimM [Bacilli bacterium]
MDYIHIGTIKGTHGIKGEVKVKSDSGFKAERFKINSTLYLKYQQDMIKIIINSYRTHNNYDLITFNNIASINDVLDYINCDIYIHKNQLPMLEDDEYYYYQLIGLKAVDGEGDLIGKIADVQEYPQGAMLVIEQRNGKLSLVPFVGTFVHNIDLENGRVVITPIEGLL